MSTLRIRALVASVALTGGTAVALTLSPTAQAAPAVGKVTTRTIAANQHTTLRSGTASGEIGPDAGVDEEVAARVPVANGSPRSRAKKATLGLSGIPVASSGVSGAVATTSFDGINHHQQRYEVAGGNQWSLEPPDQALCVANGRVFEAVNNAVAVYDSSGNRLALDSLNHFFGYPVEIDRATGQEGPQTTDPTCLYDPSTKRFFLTILTYFVDAAGNPTRSSLDTAVSPVGTPLGTWTISHIDATDDGSNGTPSHPGCPCLGDYPHIGVDAYGYYISTNEFPFAGGYNSAQIYAMSKAALAGGATTLTVRQYDTTGGGVGGQGGFTVWPAQSPTAADYATAANGTEYFLATDAVYTDDGYSTTLETWSLTGTAALARNGTPALHFSTDTVAKYAVPPPANQKPGPTPLADCLNITRCAKFVTGKPDRYKETEATLDALDSRMQQVTYAGGKLYGSHGTAVDPSGDTVQRAGIAWYITRPTTDPDGALSNTVLAQGRVGVKGQNLLDPALGVRTNGTAVIGVTLAGTNWFPSAAYVDLVNATTGPVRVAAAGLGPEDGFTGYRIFDGASARWGDYGAAALDPATGRLWVANEYIGQSCTLSEYLAEPVGECGGTRTLLANWYTRISRVG